MNILEIIEKKKNKQALSTEEIHFFVNGFTAGEIPDYQISSLLMAIVLNGMDDREIYDLTDAMLHSGDVMDLSELGGNVVDKHSTGGVGDSTTLALAPILACCGVYVAKMSGRGLDFTGGTIDKLESIPGMDIALSEEEFRKVVKEVGCCVIGQTGNLAPADKKLYALRDVTGTVDCIPLICSSVMSKKLASGSDIILLDVKFGTGAFMKTKEDALLLAEKMVTIGNRAGKSVGALITDMEQPLSDHIGNALEIVNIIDVLKGKKSRLYNELKEVAVKLLSLTDKYDEQSATVAFEQAIESGRALDKLAEMVKAQHGNERYIYHPELFKLGEMLPVYAQADGFVTAMNTAEIGRACTALGGGRMKKEDPIDYSVGIRMEVMLGSEVKKGDVLCYIYHNGKNVEHAVKQLQDAIIIGSERPQPHKIAYAFVDKDGVHLY